ncbi:hypothetical protein O181_032453 [Austropuccinia psidii MF-1]|uniref:Uncharacterized protein n=1 Tax=Austropuccinia psidii MF-1 TaxID=1389203 RepID=A0A9Q3CZH6_9BASI|nr:hypothetical protein [Austropuccinia psidii MF-1]
MMILSSDWRKNNPSPPKKVLNPSQISRSSQKLRTREKEKHQPKDYTARDKESHRFNRMPWKMCFRWPDHDGIKEKGGKKVKISEMISEILDGIINFYIAINDVKSHISDKNSSSCNNIETSNLGLGQRAETIMRFGNVSREIETSNNDSKFGNKLNGQSAIIRELEDEYSELNIENGIETRIKQAINIIK